MKKTIGPSDLAHIKGIVQKARVLFPSIKRLVIIPKNGKYYMASAKFLFINLIFVDRVCRKMANDALFAVAAHELCHLQYPQLDEREVDIKLLELGLKRELIAFHEWHNSKYKKYKSKDGLTLKGIEKWKPH